MATRTAPDPVRIAELGGRLGSALRERLAEVTGRLGLTFREYQCLDTLADGPVTAGRIAAATRLSTGAVTGLLDRLERAGHVRRRKDRGDRRRVLVECTATGASRLAAARREVARLPDAVLAECTATELRAAERCLSVWLAALPDEQP
ncbi:MarR family winged helix-turn-helix transcriptional regulator [Amycolatopsis eburnea]|uniref:MarR family winged helix-turn-helix transcriptional regulator n=1 Tax=Amycolatopsis eburnea TaxID=2267691 RepID=UPI001CDD1196|nr:MarR family transcriptional regulator [Amycolatopsis eburnea]